METLPGKYATFFLYENGTVKACGENTKGQLGLGTEINNASPTWIPDLTDVKQIAICDNNTYFLLKDGTVKACGDNTNGQIGIGDKINRNVPTSIPSLGNVKKVASFNNNALFLLGDGTVKGCGNNINYQLGLGDKNDRYIPTLIPNLTEVKDIFFSDATFFFMEDGTVKSCGYNAYGQLGLGANIALQPIPQLIPSLSNVKEVIANNCTAYFLMENGTVKSCGYNLFGGLGVGDKVNRNTPTLIPNLNGVKKVVADIIGSAYFLLENGTIKVCGNNISGQLGFGDTLDRMVPTLISDLVEIKDVKAITNNAFFTFVNGTVRGCGWNKQGSLGVGDEVKRTAHILIPGLTGIKDVKLSLNNTFFILDDGTVKGCGSNEKGNLGLGNLVNISTPTLIPNLEDESITSTTYLYLKNTEAYTEQNNTITKVSDNYQTLTNDQKKVLFEAASSEIATGDRLSALGKFKIQRYSTDNNQFAYTVTAIPHKSRVIPNELITLDTSGGIKKVSLDAQGTCKVFVTTDLTTYKNFDTATRAWTATDVGIDAADLASITQTEWGTFLNGGKQIAFAYELDMESTTDVVQFADLTITLYGGGDSWDMAVPGADYTYGYSANNLLQVSIKTNGDYKINYPG